MRDATWVILLLLAWSSSAVGEGAASWSDAFDIQGVIGEIHALEAWNDGLLIGGSFHQAGSVRASNAAIWTGSEWEALADFDGPVLEWAIFQGQLVAAGQFRQVDSTPAQSLALLSSEGWTALGAELENRDDPDRCIVRTVLAQDDRLFVGGEFTHAGDQLANGFAVWDGTEWTGLGAGLIPQYDGVPATVEALASFESGVAVGGSFRGTKDVSSSGLIHWTDAGWASIDGGVDGVVLALRPTDAGLAVGGNFRRDDLDVPLRSFGIWDGASWETMGARITGIDPTIWDIEFYGEDLVLAGAFSNVGGLGINKIAWWDGTTWRSFSSGIVSDGQINDIENFGSALIAGGTFIRAGGHSAYGLATWGGRSWNPIGVGFGMDGPVFALTAGDGFLIAGGDFERAGRRAGERCSMWNGGEWLDLEANFNGRVHTATTRPGEIFAGGLFTFFEGRASRHVAYRSDNEWLTPGGGAAAVVWDLTVWNDQVVATGAFRRAGNRPASRIATWDGSLWTPFGAGLDDTGRALQVYHDDLVIAGDFASAGGVDAQRIVLWNGFGYEPLGSGVDGEVRDFTIYEGDLIAAGSLTRAGDAAVANCARWNGTDWTAVGDSFDGPVHTVTVHDGRLVAGGEFSVADGKPASHLAVWDGSTWNPFGGGVEPLTPEDPSAVYALESWNGSLYVGGDFIFVGGTPSHHVAAWTGPIPYFTWPGDADNDGVVDGRDLLALGRSWGMTGPSRSQSGESGLDWEPSRVDPWDVPSAAYADCDGSGTVDAKDILGLVSNWKKDRRVLGFAPDQRGSSVDSRRANPELGEPESTEGRASGVSDANDSNGANNENGANGTNGANDENGASGTNSANDENGASGTNAANDKNGAYGTSGANGASGTNGASDENGTNGPNGANAVGAANVANGGDALDSPTMVAAAQEMLVLLPESAPPELRRLLQALAGQIDDTVDPDGTAQNDRFKERLWIEPVSSQPSRNWPVIRLNGTSGPWNEARLRIFDVSGREVDATRIALSNDGADVVVDLESVFSARATAGVYFIRAETLSDQATLRILVLN